MRASNVNPKDAMDVGHPKGVTGVTDWPLVIEQNRPMRMTVTERYPQGSGTVRRRVSALRPTPQAQEGICSGRHRCLAWAYAQ